MATYATLTIRLSGTDGRDIGVVLRWPAELAPWQKNGELKPALLFQGGPKDILGRFDLNGIVWRVVSLVQNAPCLLPVRQRPDGFRQIVHKVDSGPNSVYKKRTRYLTC